MFLTPFTRDFLHESSYFHFTLSVFFCFVPNELDPDSTKQGFGDQLNQSFQGSQGRAYLFNSVVNVGCGPAEERVLLTGLHAVADIYCENCKTTLGWKYVSVRVFTCQRRLELYLELERIGTLLPSLIIPLLAYKIVVGLKRCELIKVLEQLSACYRIDMDEFWS
ncbi:unnamed protein product [Oncorhynchus mykiss]|uniref:Yippee domain-containing protein n=1 Tax=Oncorhynchus mykiss TaxID=8022 RepID=A0A060WKU1_ONCMY|nr:unnamed protein product [Oncorhynchus mykiss]